MDGLELGFQDKESKRKRNTINRTWERRRREPIPPSFIVHLLHATRLVTLFCLNMHSQFFPRTWGRGHRDKGQSMCLRWSRKLAWNDADPPHWDPLLWPSTFCHNYKNVWHKTCLGPILYRRLQLGHLKAFSFPGWINLFLKFIPHIRGAPSL